MSDDTGRRFGPEFAPDPLPEDATEAEAVEAAKTLAQGYLDKGDSASLAARVAVLRYEIQHRFDDVFDAIREEDSDGGELA